MLAPTLVSHCALWVLGVSVLLASWSMLSFIFLLDARMVFSFLLQSLKMKRRNVSSHGMNLLLKISSAVEPGASVVAPLFSVCVCVYTYVCRCVHVIACMNMCIYMCMCIYIFV